jgi:hypothetical protein
VVVNDEIVTTVSHSSITSFMTSARILLVTLAFALTSRTAWADTDAIAKEVSKLRGLSIKKPIKHDTIDAKALRERLMARYEKEMTAEEIAAEQLALERWGLIAHGVDVHATLIDVLAEQIAGFYDPEDQTLYIADGGDGGDMVTAHEIVHALQDQHFDLDKLTDLPPSEADAALARQSLVEGDGVVAMFELMLAREGVPPPWGMDDAVAMMTKTMEAGAGETALDRAPLVVRDLLMFPYARGLGFVAALRATKPWKKVDDVYASPPASTEQILHPELYLAGEAPIAVTAATPAALSGWRTVQETVWGEAGWSVLLRQHGVEADRAADGAAGWGGDRVAVYAHGDDAAPEDAVGVALTTWDADIDAMEFAEAAVDALDTLVTGTLVEDSPRRWVWLGTDLRVSIVERRDDQVVVVVGAPLTARAGIADQIWKTWTVAP